MEIRKLTPEELPLRLGLCDFRDPQQMLRENEARLQKGLIDIFGLFDGNALIGELSVKYDSEDPLQTIPGQRAYLYAFRIREDYRRQGLGTALLRHVMDRLQTRGIRELTVGVEDDNPDARRLYTRAGFDRVIARKEECYQTDTYAFDLLLRKC